MPENHVSGNSGSNSSSGGGGSGGGNGGGGGGPFRMEVKLPSSSSSANRKRKRHQPTAVAVTAEDFGGGSSDDVDQQQQQQQLQQQQIHGSISPSNSSAASTVKASNKHQQQQQQETTKTASTASSTTTATSTTSSASSSSTTSTTASGNNSKRDKVQQPDGWRVKLYRLNADGSWDDCGTGRVLCLRRPLLAKPHSRALPSFPSLDGAEPTAAAAALANHHAALDAWICQELGEPTLCMHAEIVAEATAPPKILLRTRILLRDAYQRQGDNIITWCEPCYDNASNNSNNNNNNHASNGQNNNAESNSSTGGVDLALSFQDNAGCLDIWRQITSVQRHAAELYRTHCQQQSTESSSDTEKSTDSNTPTSSSSSSSSSNNNNHASQATLSVTEMASKIAQDHHAELERQQHQEMWVSMTGGASIQHHQQQQQQQQHQQHQQHRKGFVEVDENNNPQQQHQQHQQQQLHHGHGHNHRPGNKQQQQQHALGEHHGPFEDGSGDMSPYTSINHPEHPANNNNMMGATNNPNSNNAVGALSPQLPNPPTLSNLEEIADTIARVQHIQVKESLAMFISQNDCAYLKLLLSLFPAAEDRGDYGSLATLAACVKTILLLNDPSILELIVAEEVIFEEVCATLEYDPDLRDKANHRWFLRERARFRTVVLMEDKELIAAIHRAFRVNYLRDTLLRPTMDESSLSTLSSLQTFTHADVVKGVTISPPPQSSLISNGGHDHHGHHDHDGKDCSAQDSYLVRVIRVLGVELHALCHMEWAELENLPDGSTNNLPDAAEQMQTDPSIVISSAGEYIDSQNVFTTWRQYLAPQDGSLASRRIRRRGCLTFLRELFNMVRISLQQSDKDNFFSVIVSMEIEVMSSEDQEKGGKISDNESQTSKIVEVGSVAASEKSERYDDKGETSSQHLGLDFMPLSTPVNLLSLLGTVLSDPTTDVTEKGLVLEIIAGVAMHDPALIRRHCLEFHSSWKRNHNHQHQDRDTAGLGRPEANEKKQVIFLCPPNDLLAALLYLLDAETDAGILLQVSEIMRIILDTDMMGDHHGTGFAGEDEHGGVFADETEGIPPSSGGVVQAQPYEQHNQENNGGSVATKTEQKQFLSMFYEHFIDWVVAPFQFTILHPVRRVPDTVLISPSDSPLLMRMMKAFKDGVTQDDGLFRIIPRSAIRTSFAVELLSFCVRAHLYRMKIFLLKSKVLSNVLKLLKPQSVMASMSGDRCLKLAALRFLRAILSVNDEFYHRHIIHHNLFEPVFEAFRSNPVGDNLVSSAIVEMCDFINNENIKSLMEHIVTRHLSVTRNEETGPSLEDVSSPYVNTLTSLRQNYEHNLKASHQQQQQQGKIDPTPESPDYHGGNSRYFSGKALPPGPRVLSGKALEDQRKFREEHEEESYFDSDDDADIDQPEQHPPSSTVVPPAVDEVAAQEGEGELHRTTRIFSLEQAPIPGHTNSLHLQQDQALHQEPTSEQCTSDSR